MQKTDINKLAQTILIPLLAEVYGYQNLKDLDFTEGSNYPSVDLGDETARVAFQITSTRGIEKVKHTLTEFVEHKLYEKYDRIIIYIITDRQKDYSDTEINKIIQGKLSFDVKNDIWDYRNILGEVAKFPIEKAREVEKLLEANFGEERKEPDWEVVDKVEQIINESTELFVGGSEKFQKLDNFLADNSRGVMLVTAGAGFGKTSLLANWVDRERQGNRCFIAYHFFSQQYDKTRSVKSAYWNLLRQIYIYYELYHEQLPNEQEELRNRLYNILKERGARQDKPLVIVIDALDEIDAAAMPFSLPFLTPLPQNVFVIVSARAEPEEEPKYLENWTEKSQNLHLKYLPREAIADWLRETGDGELAVFAEDTNFVTQLDEITQGFPLYLSYLIDELSHAVKQGIDLHSILARTPKGFSLYVKQQFQQLANVAQIRQQPEVKELFALLSVALGVLSEDDIQELTNLDEWGLPALPRQVTRWFSVQKGFYSFAHPLLAKEFQSVLKRQSSSAMENLIKYCARWQKHSSPYALRHYAEHLSEAKQWEALYVIARNKDFAVTQEERLPDEPDLPLKTVQTALLGAAETDNATGMAEFMLLHARRLLQTTAQDSPLDALQKGSLERAWKLTDLYEIEPSVVWYLLLAWELKDTGQLEEARETLKRLQQKELPRLPINRTVDGQCDYASYAAYLLAYIFEVNEETCIALHQKLFEYNTRCQLYQVLIDRERFQDALKIAEVTIVELKQVLPLSNILKAQLKKENSQGARAIFFKIRAIFVKTLEITRKTFPSMAWIWWMGDLAKAQIEMGEKQEAITIFAQAIENIEDSHQIENLKPPTWLWIEIANIQADLGLFSDARETLQRIDFTSDLEDSLISLAEVQAKLGDKEQAQILLNQAKQLAQNIESKSNQVYDLSNIASTQAKIGDLAKALEMIEENIASLSLIDREGLLLEIVKKEECDHREFTAVLETANRIYEKLESSYHREQLLKIIVAIQARQAQKFKKDFTAAMTTTNKIKEPHCESQALLIIVNAQVELKWFNQALETAQIIKIKEDKEKALLGILQEQALAGQVEDALTIYSQIQERSKQQDALVAIAKAYAKAKNFSDAIKIANQLFNPHKEVELLKSIATIQSQACLAKEARDTLAMGLKVSFSSERSYDHIFALINIAALLMETHQNEKGLAYVKNIDEFSNNINNNWKEKVNVLAVLGELYAKADRRNEAKDIFNRALEIVQKVEKPISPSHIDLFIVGMFTKIGIAQARSGEFEAALETVQKIKLMQEKALVLKTLAQAHPNAEQREILKTALTTLYEDALSSVDLGFDHSVTIMSSIAVARKELGEREEALAIFAEACERVKQEKIKVIKTNPDSLLSTVAVAEAEAGEITLALENAAKIEGAFEQVKTLSKIASFQWKKGDKEGLSATLDAAFNVQEKITDKQKQGQALSLIAQIQAIAGQVEQAMCTAEQILNNRNQLLCHIAAILAQLNDKESFKKKKLLIPCAYSLKTAYQMCGLLARLYPEKAETIAKVVSGLN
ncbi:SMEK domain-containing protein [Microcoleus sp. K1-B6]|uniref:SMEK domain-containing protein n=1 Tax=unclassified Microcoleus TaxID=2642155 RepID=UPI002FD4FE51